MGLFNKIKEMIKKNKTPKLNAGENYQQNQETKKTNCVVLPYAITLPNGEELLITSIELKNKAKHRNGEKTNIMIAKAHCYEDGETIYFEQQESLAFEILEGTQIDDIILKKIGQYFMYEKNMPDNNKDCIYLGRISQDPYEFGTNNKNETVKKYIDETVAPQIAREKQEQIEKQLESYREREERENLRQKEFKNRMQKEHEEYLNQQNKIRTERIENPYLKEITPGYTEVDGKKYCDYNGVNVLNGDILKLRKMNKVGKDENGTYLYTAYAETTEHEYDAEMYLEDGTPAGIPICFATDKKIEEIIQSNDQNDLRTILSMLSESERFRNNNENLNYIGYINKYNVTDKNIQNTTRTIQSTVSKLQQEFYQKKIQAQEREQEEK